jgi:hypothetical protein
MPPVAVTLKARAIEPQYGQGGRWSGGKSERSSRAALHCPQATGADMDRLLKWIRGIDLKQLSDRVYPLQFEDAQLPRLGGGFSSSPWVHVRAGVEGNAGFLADAIGRCLEHQRASLVAAATKRGDQP